IGIKFGTFPLIANYAGKLWQQMEVDRLEGLAKIYRFNLSNPAEQLRHIHTTEEEILLEDDIELSNPSEDLYSDEPNLNLKISNIIDLQFSVFTCTYSRTSFEDLDRDVSDNDMQDDGESEYNVDEIVARQLD
ncbi:6891_t:CDS:2, partial [Gigaspora rosea]